MQLSTKGRAKRNENHLVVMARSSGQTMSHRSEQLLQPRPTRNCDRHESQTHLSRAIHVIEKQTVIRRDSTGLSYLNCDEGVAYRKLGILDVE